MVVTGLPPLSWLKVRVELNSVRVPHSLKGASVATTGRQVVSTLWCFYRLAFLGGAYKAGYKKEPTPAVRVSAPVFPLE